MLYPICNGLLLSTFLVGAAMDDDLGIYFHESQVQGSVEWTERTADELSPRRVS